MEEFRANNIALKDSLDDTEKKLDHVKLSLNRSESHVKRLPQQIWELYETEHVLQEAAEFEGSRAAFREVVRTNFLWSCESRRNVTNSLSRDVLDRLFFLFLF